MLKHCPEHGAERVLIADDVDYYRRCREVFLKPPEMPQRYNTPVKWGCPYDCGLCTDHEQHSCLSLVEIADDCNLRCPICYAVERTRPPAASGRSRRSSACSTPSCANEGEPDVVQISGGEPTMHPDFFAVLDAGEGAADPAPDGEHQRRADRARARRSPSGWRRTCRTSRSTCSSTRSSATRCSTLRGADLRAVRAKALERLNASASRPRSS